MSKFITLVNSVKQLREIQKSDLSDFLEADYVHTSGDETIGGNKTFEGIVTINELSVTNLTNTTDDIEEGSSNLYFTEERAQDAVGAILQDNAFVSFNYDDANNSLEASLVNGSVGADQIAQDVDVSNKGFNSDQVDGRDVNDSQVSTNALWTAAKVKAYVDGKVNGVDWQESVISIDELDPTTLTPTSGDRYFINGVGTDVWTGKDYQIAEFDGTGWTFITIDEGGAFWVENRDKTYIWNGSALADLGSTSTHNNLTGLQGGDGSDEFYHLTNAQHQALTSGANADGQHNHTTAAITDWATKFATDFDAKFSAKSTDDLSEGTTNLYYTDERVDDRAAELIQDGTGITWAYDDTAGTLTPTVDLGSFSTDDLEEGTSNLYYTDERVDDRVNDLLQNGTGITWVYDDATGTLTPSVNLGDFTTDDLGEGDNNLYFTEERAKQAAGISFDYVAAEALSAGDLVAIYDDSGTLKAKKANATDDSSPCAGYVSASVTAGSNVTVYFGGINSNLSGLIPGKKYFLSTTTGTLTTVAPDQSGNIIQNIGIAISPSDLKYENNEYMSVQ